MLVCRTNAEGKGSGCVRRPSGTAAATPPKPPPRGVLRRAAASCVVRMSVRPRAARRPPHPRPSNQQPLLFFPGMHQYRSTKKRPDLCTVATAEWEARVLVAGNAKRRPAARGGGLETPGSPWAPLQRLGKPWEACARSWGALGSHVEHEDSGGTWKVSRSLWKAHGRRLETLGRTREAPGTLRKVSGNVLRVMGRTWRVLERTWKPLYLQTLRKPMKVL